MSVNPIMVLSTFIADFQVTSTLSKHKCVVMLSLAGIIFTTLNVDDVRVQDLAVSKGGT